MFETIRYWAERASQLNSEKSLARWLNRIPLAFFRVLCEIVGTFIYWQNRSLRFTIIENMDQILGQHAKRLRKKQARLYFVNLVKTLLEILVLTRRFVALPGKLNRLFDVQGEESIANALKAGRGVILYSPHLGNFFFYYWYLSQKYDCLTVATAQPDIRFLYEIYAQLGCKGMDYDKTPPLQMVKQLKTHLANNGVVMLLGDFYRDHFPNTKWFGKTTKSPMGAAVLALEQQVPIIPFYGKQLGGFTHQLVFHAPISIYDQFTKNERLEATNYLNQTMERMVREAPEQWFYWFSVHERFVELKSQ